MRPMPPMHPMPQAASNQSASLEKLVIEFDASVQALGALEAAAYRLIGTATCQIERVGDRFVCHLTQDGRGKPSRGGHPNPNSLRAHFLNVVTDENLRARLADKTEGIRNVTLALAFGSLAASQKEPD